MPADAARTIESGSDTTMLQNMKLPMIALAFAGLGRRRGHDLSIDGAGRAHRACRPGATALARLELLFGMGKKDGSEVSDTEWRAFLDTEVSPRFPDG
jgi:hypothetical protein